MKHSAIRRIGSLATLTGVALTVTACDLRRDGDEDQPEPAATETPADPLATPSETSSPVASILRNDLPGEEGIDLPPQPVELTIPFPDGAQLSQRAERMLVGILREDALDEDWPVIIGGHTDSGGNDQANLRASRSRAEAVAAWLVERGVADERITVIAFGEQNPIAPNALPDGSPNEEGRRQNRRVELRIAPPPEDEESEVPETNPTRRLDAR